jgi:hypothetical protein
MLSAGVQRHPPDVLAVGRNGEMVHGVLHRVVTVDARFELERDPVIFLYPARGDHRLDEAARRCGRSAIVPARSVHGRCVCRCVAHRAGGQGAGCTPDRKELIARLYGRRYLADRGPLRGIDAEDDDAMEHFDQLMDGALAID